VTAKLLLGRPTVSTWLFSFYILKETCKCRSVCKTSLINSNVTSVTAWQSVKRVQDWAKNLGKRRDRIDDLFSSIATFFLVKQLWCGGKKLSRVERQFFDVIGFPFWGPDEPEELELGNGSAEPRLKLRLLRLLAAVDGFGRWGLTGPERRA